MRVVIDIECNRLHNPDQIWVIVVKDIDTGVRHIFRNVTRDEVCKESFRSFWRDVRYVVGHNICGYDLPIIARLLGVETCQDSLTVIDTLIISRMADYAGRKSHGIKDFGIEFELYKGEFKDWSKWSQEMEDYCVRDVDICHKVYTKYLRYIKNPKHEASINLEHSFQIVANSLHDNGFAFNVVKAERLLNKVTAELKVLDDAILSQFPPRLKLVREVTPKETKYGTISLSSIPRSLRDDLADFSVGASFCYCNWIPFNASSPKQIIEVLNEAGWSPVDKTKTHIETERELEKLRREKHRSSELDIRFHLLYTKLKMMERTGWKVNETNLATLPASAPAPARTIARRILLEARRRTLTEWLGLVQEDGRVHGEFFGIGAWTHRMAHQKPNTANIPNDKDTAGNIKLYGKEMRSLWIAPKNRLLLGVDAEGIQLRIFAHYINDPEFTEALVNGKKEDKSDPHSLNQRILGDVCKSRAAAKRFIFALLLGAGLGKLAEILGCSREEAEAALDRLIGRYAGFEHLKTSVVPADARRGWFSGLDGRSVPIPGDAVGLRKHLCMSGYLQNGEAVVMKKATLKWHHRLKDFDAKLVDFIHDEWQIEGPNDVGIMLEIAKMVANSLIEVGEELKLNCPLAGSYFNDDIKDYTIGTNWYQTH